MVPQRPTPPAQIVTPVLNGIVLEQQALDDSQQVLACSMCNFTAKNQRDVQQHMRTHRLFVVGKDSYLQQLIKDNKEAKDKTLDPGQRDSWVHGDVGQQNGELFSSGDGGLAQAKDGKDRD